MSTMPLVYQMKLWLCDIEPAIWRRLEVPAEITLPRLHRVIQIVMGWEDYHLHEFRVCDQRYEVPDPESLDDGAQSLDERRVKLNAIGHEVGMEFSYLYDFGDGWEHLLRLEAILPGNAEVQYPRCLDGARSGPPEDAGGPPGYEDYLEALADPHHERHEELLGWRGPFDPEKFDLKAINQKLARSFRARH
jgi:hypothetical protein